MIRIPRNSPTSWGNNMPVDAIAIPTLPLPVQLHVHDQVGLIDAIRVAVDVLESLEFPHRPRRRGYRSQALAALALLSWGNKKRRGTRDAVVSASRRDRRATERRKHFGNAEKEKTHLSTPKSTDTPTPAV